MNKITEQEKKELIILHRALVIGAFFIMAIITFVLVKPDFSDFNFELDILHMAGIVIAIISPVVGFIASKKQLSIIDKSKITKENYNIFRAAHLQKWATLEGPVLINTILFFQVEVYYFYTLQ